MACSLLVMDGADRDSRMVPFLQQQYALLAELEHQINNPLEAIRNALYLAESHARDPEVRRYLAVANDEIRQITHRMSHLRRTLETDRRFVLSTTAEIAEEGSGAV